MSMGKRDFPKDFIWAAGNSAIQCEGGNVNSDWHYFEKFGFVKSNEEIGMAVDHYHRYKEDFDLAKKLSQTGHRFTIEWSRIETKKGQYNYEEIDHYRDVLKYLHKIGLKSIVTLHHFSNPTWFALQGGWAKKESIEIFNKYVSLITEELGELIDFWIVINEPTTYIGLSYLLGVLPPLKHNPLSAYKVINNMATANNVAYQTIHNKFPNALVSCANNCQLYTDRKGITKGLFKDLLNYVSNFYFIDKTKMHQDFIGLNYYFPWRFIKVKDVNHTDMGWEIYPKGLSDSISTLWRRYNKPIFVMENGIADKNDKNRTLFIKSHISAMMDAIENGAKVIGYTYWSLTDNFELAEGFGPKFGLISVDRETMSRQIKISAHTYKKICESNSIEI